MSVENSMAGKNYDDVIDKVAEKVVRKYGIRIASGAKLLCPVDTGRLRGSITYQTKSFGGRPEEAATQADVIAKPTDQYTAFVGTNVDYAFKLEYGTERNMQGHPFLRPAIDTVAKGATAEAALEIRKAMKEENRKRFI